MWSALGKMTSAVTNTFYTSGEQPAFDCAWPPRDVGDLRGCGQMADEQYKQVQQLHNDPQWALHEHNDPDGLDLKLFSRPTIGTYHFLKCTFTIPNCTIDQFVNLVGCPRLAVRQTFSADCIALKKIDEPTPMTELLHCQYWAPPPVAHRDFCFLVGRRDNGDNSYDIWGCSVKSDLCPEQNGLSLVRGASLWGWKVIQVGEALLAQYSNCFDPRGWTPHFVLEWLKTSAAKEFCAIRAVLMGKKADIQRLDFSAAGVTEEEVKQAQKDHEAGKD